VRPDFSAVLESVSYSSSAHPPTSGVSFTKFPLESHRITEW